MHSRHHRPWSPANYDRNYFKKYGTRNRRRTAMMHTEGRAFGNPQLIHKGRKP